MFAGTKLVTPVGMVAPLTNVFLVMGTEVLAILGAEMVIRPALIVVVAVIRAPFLILIPAAIVFPVLRDSCTREYHQRGCEHDPIYKFVRDKVHMNCEVHFTSRCG